MPWSLPGTVRAALVLLAWMCLGALAQARAGRTFSAPELLALQAGAYRFGQAVEVAAKVAEAAAQSVRQAVNAQV